MFSKPSFTEFNDDEDFENESATIESFIGFNDNYQNNSIWNYISPKSIENKDEKESDKNDSSSDTKTSNEILNSPFPENKEEKESDKNDSSRNNNISIEKSTNKKRGRKKEKNGAIHTKFKNDCRMAKIQIGYFTFLINFLNIIMKKLDIKYNFLNIKGKLKSNVNQDYRASLINKTIKEILNAPISTKYKKYNSNHNINIINKLKEEHQIILLKILDKNFLYFFENIYFSNTRKFNLSLFGLNYLEVELPDNIKLYKDLINKLEEDQDFIRYEGKMEKCAKKYFVAKTDINAI